MSLKLKFINKDVGYFEEFNIAKFVNLWWFETLRIKNYVNN